MELQNSLLRNINDDGDNNDKKQKNLKTWVGIFKTWVKIFQVEIFWVGTF